MMKKLIVLVMLFAMMLVGLPFLNAQEAETDKKEPCDAKTFSLSVGAGYRNFSEDLFKEVYGNAPMTINVDLGVRVWKSLEIFVHTDYLKVEGETTLTKEDTTLTIFPIELGARYLANVSITKSCRMKLFPYIGAGAGYYSIKEENPIGTVDENRVGFFAEGGLRFYPMKSFFIDAKLKQVVLKSENGTNLGGFAYMGSIGVSF
ncbi:MAG: outer membrane beta-barrel protein [Candidatus Aminicenantes bacterium]|nr:outer membrane beta-barrel protein [Candidatus Aminicenantes bacterium]NIM80407.1 outer membrane beta-barrel protein [Candidatus Aminicenantes bacterium]NIN19794.1 outer membrane beta-barrel protein [Candidatus Aminicenantes bacterium]NIN43676.1 outer membrane beta-barrel protein [Candidatus Aminicenantes bacterium]NIN86421.1 outer membrane beta-barrel protein [Candidatus Aminicenantes bacterium]